MTASHPVLAISKDMFREYDSLTFQGGVISGLHFYLMGYPGVGTQNAADWFVYTLTQQGAIDALVSLFMVPDGLSGYTSTASDWSWVETGFQYNAYKELNTSTVKLMETKSITKNGKNIYHYIDLPSALCYNNIDKYER